MVSSLILSLAAVSSLHSPAALEDYMISRAVAHNYSVTKFLAIAEAESGFNINAKNKGSSASGLFQYINGTFKTVCIDTYHLTNSMQEKNNAYIQTECAVMMLKEKGGDSHWLASKPAWSKKLLNQT